MISKMRDFAPAVMWVVIVAFVATIFFAWGMDFTSSKRDGLYVGSVGSEQITMQSFSQRVEMKQEELRQQNGGVEPAPEQMRRVPREVWETEVQRILLSKIFDKMGLYGSADEVYAVLKDNPPPEVTGISAFQTEEKFDPSKFERFLNDPKSYDQPGMIELENYYRTVMVPGQKLNILLSVGKTPSRLEIEREYAAKNDRAVFEYCGVRAADFPVPPQSITEAQIAAYYTAHPDSFKTEAAAELYFAAVPKVATASDDAAAFQELVDVKKGIESGAAVFAEEAKAVSDDEGSGRQGGELGTFGRGQMVPAFEAVAFSLDTGKISDPVRTQFGWHIIRVSKREMAGDSVVKVTASHILRKVEPSTETIDSLDAYVENLRSKMLEKGIKEIAATEKGLYFDSTGLFLKNQMIPKIGFVGGAAGYAFGNEHAEKVSDKFENRQGFFVFAFKRMVPKGTLALTDVRERIVTLLADSLSRARAKDHIDEARTHLAALPGLAKLDSLDAKLYSGVTDTVTRSSFIPKLGYEGTAASVAFVLDQGTLSKTVRTEDGYALVKPLWVSKAPAAPKSGPEIDQAVATLVSSNQRAAYPQWYMGFRGSVKIVDEVDRYYE